MAGCLGRAKDRRPGEGCATALFDEIERSVSRWSGAADVSVLVRRALGHGYVGRGVRRILGEQTDFLMTWSRFGSRERPTLTEPFRDLTIPMSAGCGECRVQPPLSAGFDPTWLANSSTWAPRSGSGSRLPLKAGGLNRLRGSHSGHGVMVRCRAVSAKLMGEASPVRCARRAVLCLRHAATRLGADPACAPGPAAG